MEPIEYEFLRKECEKWFSFEDNLNIIILLYSEEVIAIFKLTLTF
jgi:hypothetical protein